MLAFKYRFHGHGSLKYIYTHGKSVRSHLMTLKYTTHPKRKTPRVAVVVSKKVYKGAVGRNRIRRRIYEIVRLHLPNIEQNTELVIIVFSAEILALPQDELKQTVEQLFQSAAIYKK